MKMMLFGSILEDEKNAGDVDVVIIGGKDDEIHSACDILEPYSIEKGGVLDLFVDNGIDFNAAYDPDRRIWIGSAKGGEYVWKNITQNWKEISMPNLIELLTKFKGEHNV